MPAMTWDGPTIATVTLAAATVAITALGVISGLLAFWGFATLREHAAEVAKKVAEAAAKEATDQRMQTLLKEWGLSAAPEESDDAAAAALQKE
jgi:hypothetical protein